MAKKLTPMMEQYMEIKEQNKDCILMFRLGDFYEMFMEDAKEAARILDITLTSRNKKGQDKTPMCGIPFHSLDQYLPKLTKEGKKVAICEQVTKPTGKGIVKREVVKIITPGTTIDENILEQGSNNYASLVMEKKGKFGFAYADISTGEFKVTSFSDFESFKEEFFRVSAKECLAEDGLSQKLKFMLKNRDDISIFPFKASIKDPDGYIRNQFKINSLSIFGLKDGEIENFVAAELINYLKDTQKSEVQHIKKINRYSLSSFMNLEESTVRNLEIFYNNYDFKVFGSLVSVVDQCSTAMGSRKLKKWLRYPLIKKDWIEERLEKVELFFNNSSLQRRIREELSSLRDIERLLARLSLGSGNARDLYNLGDSLGKMPSLKELLENRPSLNSIDKEISVFDDLTKEIVKAINPEAPNSVRDGGMILEGYSEELDEYKGISSEGKDFIKNLQKEEIQKTGISSLKVKFNKVFGYYIEVSKANLDLVPERYIRKQTLVNAERYIVPELKDYEEKVLTAQDKIKELEYELFYNLRMKVIEKIKEIQSNADAIARLDVLTNFAYIANKFNYTKPQLVDERVLEIEKGRHPVIEQILNQGDFVPNDINFEINNYFALLTGPNMGGKSTFLRQNALIVLLAQVGAFVPAQRAKLGLVDRIFTRVGASDNLSAGESTFMVEMQEAANILNNASSKSLIILDEIGRGTSTYDGVSIAWAITHYIHDKIGARTIFATHYHELVDLVQKLSFGQNLSVEVQDEGEEVVFLHKISEGGANKSYGIEVAQRAGIPSQVVEKARSVLGLLEENHQLVNKDSGENKVNQNQANIFDKVENIEKNHRKHRELSDKVEKMGKILKKITEQDINQMTPINALQSLSDLQDLIKDVII